MGDAGITPAKHVLNEADERGRAKQARRLEWRQSPQSQGRRLAPPDGLWGIISNTRLVRWMARKADEVALLRRLRLVLWDRSDAMDRPVTSILWLAKDRNKLDPWLDLTALLGLSISALILVIGAANVPMILALWICQRSLMTVGGPWYGFGWEPQLAEVFFHTLFIVPVLSLKSIPNTPVPPIVSWTFRWLLFRVMLGAGLIKFRSGDRKWKDLTAMYYFYETQPVPNPLTRYFHRTPKWWHKWEVLSNHFVELVAPWLLIIPLLPTGLRRFSGYTQIIFQSILITSGNLSFLNWLTMLPAIFCFDDALLGPMFFSQQTCNLASMAPSLYPSPTRLRQFVSLAFAGMVAQLSVPVVRNLRSEKQIMNASFDPLRLINTYGAFGVVEEDRQEIIISSTPSIDEDFREYEFKVKPGRLDKRPRFISPYHYRLDWQLWIAATTRRIERNTWLYSLLIRLLQQDAGVMRLLDKDPWEGSATPPKYIRVDMYKYKFHRRQKGEKKEVKVDYWEREFMGRLYPRQGIATVASLEDELRKLYPERYAD
jgi:lipase maturation factor 1